MRSARLPPFSTSISRRAMYRRGPTEAAVWCVALAVGGAWTAIAAAAPAAPTPQVQSAQGNTTQGSPAKTDDPRAWLSRAYRALATRNYRGVFVHEFAGETETLHIVHRVGPDGLAERLQSMDGSGREFIRRGGQLYCYLPDRHMVLVERSPDSGLLLGGLLSPEGTLGEQYRVRQVARARTLGRMTRVIAIEPMDQLRYGYQVWIDEATAMPLRMQLRDARGRILEQNVFTELVLPTHIAAAELAPAVNARNYRWVQQDASTVTSPNVPGLSVIWQERALPPGFHMTASTRQMLPGGPAEHLVFSDGLASVSVFVQPRRDGNGAPPGDDSASLGTSSAYSVALRDYRVTVVGEVPPQTVRAIARAFHSAASSPEFSDSSLGVATPLPVGSPSDAAAMGVPALLPGFGRAILGTQALGLPSDALPGGAQGRDGAEPPDMGAPRVGPGVPGVGIAPRAAHRR